MLKKILLIIGTFIMSMVCLMTLIIGWLGWTGQRNEAIIYLPIVLDKGLGGEWREDTE